MKTKVLIIILFLITCGALYYVFLNKTTVMKSYPSHKDSSGQILTPIPTGRGDLQNPQTWSRYTYDNTFSISYPPEWDVVLDQSGNGVSFTTPNFHQDDDFTVPYGNSTSVSYSIFGQSDLSDMSLQKESQFADDVTKETDVVGSIDHMQINGFEAVEFDYYPTDNIHFVKTRIAIQKGQKLYRFDASYAEKSGKALFEQMVKSMNLF